MQGAGQRLLVWNDYGCGCLRRGQSLGTADLMVGRGDSVLDVGIVGVAAAAGTADVTGSAEAPTSSPWLPDSQERYLSEPRLLTRLDSQSVASG